MRYGTIIPIAVRGRTESHIFEFSYQLLDVSVKRIALVREVWELLPGGRVRAEWFRLACPQSVWEELEAEMILHYDKVRGLALAKVSVSDIDGALERIC